MTRALALRTLLTIILTVAACAGDRKDGGVGLNDLDVGVDVTSSDATNGEAVSVSLQPSQARYVRGEKINVRCQLDISPLPADVEARFAVMWLDGERGEQVRLNEVGAAWFPLVVPLEGGAHDIECSVARPDGTTLVGSSTFDVNYPPEDGDVVTPVYSWRVNDVALPGGEGQASYTPSSYGRGDALGCCVALSDGSASSALTCSEPVVLGRTDVFC